MARKRHIDWSSQPLGTVPDADIARALDCSPSTVRHARVTRGIAAPPTWHVDWDARGLGALPDRVIAERHGLNRATVTAARNRLGIRPPPRFTDEQDTAVVRLRALVLAAEPGTRLYAHRLATATGLGRRSVARYLREHRLVRGLVTLQGGSFLSHWVRTERVQSVQSVQSVQKTGRGARVRHSQPETAPSRGARAVGHDAPAAASGDADVLGLGGGGR